MSERCDYWYDVSVALDEPNGEAMLAEPIELLCVKAEGHDGQHLLATADELNANYPEPVET